MDLRMFAAFWIDIMDEIPGKKAFQKLVYFGQVLGIPFKQSYKMHFYGPYSDSVALQISLAEAENIINYQGYKFVAGSETERLTDEGREEIRPYLDKLELLMERFGDMTPSQLELYATTHYIDNQQKRLYNNYNRNHIINKILEVKGTKFTPEQVKEAYLKLQDWAMLHETEPN